MTDNYTHLWIKQYGDVGGDTFLTWAKALRKFAPMTIVAAADLIIREGMEFPPNLIKFRRFCNDAMPTPAHQRFVELPPPDRTTPEWIEARDKHFDECRKLGVL